METNFKSLLNEDSFDILKNELGEEEMIELTKEINKKIEEAFNYKIAEKKSNWFQKLFPSKGKTI